MITPRITGAMNNGESIADNNYQEKDNCNHQAKKHRVVWQWEKALPVLWKIYGEMNDE